MTTTNDSGQTDVRFYPQAKLFWHGDRMQQWLTTGRTNPVLAEIAVTGYCNARCPWCFFRDKSDSERIDTEVMLYTIPRLKLIGLKAINWTGGGEPTVHPDFDKFVEAAANHGLKQGIFSNGYKEIPHQDKFEWIRISLTDKGLRAVKIPKVPFGVCVNHIAKYTEDDIRKLCRESRIIGAKYFQIRPALTKSYKNQPVLQIPKYLEEYETDDFKIYTTDYKYVECTKPKDYPDCYGYHFCPSIDWHGNVCACLYLLDNPKYIYGNIYDETIESIWTQIPKQAPVIDACQNCCKNHEINKILYKAKHIKSVDFL